MIEPVAQPKVAAVPVPLKGLTNPNLGMNRSRSRPHPTHRNHRTAILAVFISLHRNALVPIPPKISMDLPFTVSLLDPVGDKDIGLMLHRAVAVRGPHQPLAV
jgi:hypothetical protein